MDRDAIKAELLEIEGMLQDEPLKDEDRHAARRAAGFADVLDRETWHPAPRRSIALTSAVQQPRY
jgi:hypothetical protein